MISVIIPTYNRAGYLRKAIESVLGQTYRDFEIIVVDDSSTDNTRGVALEYKNAVKCIFQENRERAAARNNGVVNAKGEYIAFLDSDDMWMTNHLEVCLEALKKSSDAGVAFSGSYVVDDSDRVLSKVELMPFNGFVLKEIVARFSSGGCNASSCLVKKRIGPTTKLLHVINHFGMPQPWDEITAIGREVGIPILEDNAYSIFSRFGNRLFGTFGDMAVFSLRKNLPLIDGGLLRINNSKYSINEPPKKAKLFYKPEIAGVFGIIKSSIGYYNISAPIRNLRRKFNKTTNPPPPLYSDEDGYPEWPLRDYIGPEFSCDYLRPISRLARFQLSGFSEHYYADIMDRKRQYYSWLSKELKDTKEIEILWPGLPEGIIPFCFSFLVCKKRDALLDSLQRKYDVMAWPTLPKSVLEKLESFPDVELLGRRLLQINLPADKVISKGFPVYLKNLVSDMRVLADRFLK